MKSTYPVQPNLPERERESERASARGIGREAERDRECTREIGRETELDGIGESLLRRRFLGAFQRENFNVIFVASDTDVASHRNVTQTADVTGVTDVEQTKTQSNHSVNTENKKKTTWSLVRSFAF